MHTTAVVVFALTYIGVALGGIPGLLLDRTGIALLGAIAMVGLGVLDTGEAMASIDQPTLLLLYSLMVLSAQFRLGGFYTRVALGVTRHLDRPRLFLAVMMGVAALLSAVLANDIVCLAFTPVLTVAVLRAGLNPMPFLIGLACASNIGSAATIIGNPQNMLIGQVGRLHFGSFLLWCGPPTLLSLAVAFAAIAFLYRGRFRGAAPRADVAADWPAYDAHQTRKGLLLTGGLLVLFFTPVPREVSALVVAGWLLCSRRLHTRSLLGLVDWHLITLFCGLFVVVRGLEVSDAPARAVALLAGHGVDLRNLYVLTGVAAALSNVVSNVPATMLLVKFLPGAPEHAWYVLALASTLAGNLVTIGSIANLIVIEQAKACGVELSFREHARAGVPVTLLTLGVVVSWIALAA